jgi:predicted GNAT family N-acyltransferase
MEQANAPREIHIAPVRGEGDLASALAIREIVFIEEQHVPESLEKDEDDSRAFHVLAYDGGHAIGTGRLVPISPPPQEAGAWGRIGRMAVLAAYRHRGVGKKILAELESEAARREYTGVLLHAQVHARDFYARHGYEDAGSVFEEAGMPHVMMRKRLGAPSP